ncbi:hypothetical protein GPECTOR_86g378 [Gonium pectorale]|uniref:H/ACA ribonucleoprotein complex subunit n=1 Tax=Gonium pectorale TaxID=33097 RepID=A0A150G260_GONPE|nr:hypothetical protein GPECTOR_86g378 [Gonium pectorale]|eukprot:KXZ43585.1 hypothetical protein GPECTOR_86g378 [Gonium pectorale]
MRGEAVVKLTNEKIPYFNAPIFLENKTQIGKVEEILGPINSVYFTIKMSEGVVATSYKAGDKFFIDPMKLLPLERFLPKPKGAPGAGGGRGCLTGQELPVRGVDARGLYTVLRFFYTGECLLEPTSAIPIYDAAHRLAVPGLSAACDAYIRRVLCPETACSLLQHALRFEMADYASACSRVIRSSFDAVVQTDGFLCLDMDALLRLLEDNIPHQNEGSVFRAAWRWGMSSVRRMQDMPRLFKLVKVPNLSMRDLVVLAGPLPAASQLPRSDGSKSGREDAMGGTSGWRDDAAATAAAARLREAQEMLMNSMLGGMDLVQAVRVAVELQAALLTSDPS